jgi:hypothetical protein
MGYWTSNKRELKVVDEYLSQGWKCINNGYPDFLFYKETTDNKMIGFWVEVKRKPCSPVCKSDYGVLLNQDQKEAHEILRKMGFEVKVIYKD